GGEAPGTGGGRVCGGGAVPSGWQWARTDPLARLLRGDVECPQPRRNNDGYEGYRVNRVGERNALPESDQFQLREQSVHRNRIDDGGNDDRQRGKLVHGFAPPVAPANDAEGQQRAEQGCQRGGDQGDLEAAHSGVDPDLIIEIGLVPAQRQAGRREAQI